MSAKEDMMNAMEGANYSPEPRTDWYSDQLRNIDEALAPSWRDSAEARPEDRSLIEQHRNAIQNNPRMNGDGSISTVYIHGVSGPDGRIYNVPGYDYETGEFIEEANLYDYWARKGRIKDFSSFAPDEGQLANEQAQRIHSEWIEPDMQAYGFNENENHKLANAAIRRGVGDATGEPIQNMTSADAAKNYAGAADWSSRVRNSMPEWLPRGTRTGLASGISNAMAHVYQLDDLRKDIAPMGLGAAFDDYLFDIGGNVAGIRGGLQGKDPHVRTPDELVREGLDYGYKQR